MTTVDLSPSPSRNSHPCGAAAKQLHSSPRPSHTCGSPGGRQKLLWFSSSQPNVLVPLATIPI
jgi:hypothetical protein